MEKHHNNELDLCIFDCTIKQKDCVFMYVVALKDRHCFRTAIFYTSLLTFKVVSSDCFLYIDI